MKFVSYAVRRDHGTETGFFRVQVKEYNAHDEGVGFQFFWRGVVYGCSFLWKHWRRTTQSEPAPRKPNRLYAWFQRLFTRFGGHP